MTRFSCEGLSFKRSNSKLYERKFYFDCRKPKELVPGLECPYLLYISDKRKSYQYDITRQYDTNNLGERNLEKVNLLCEKGKKLVDQLKEKILYCDTLGYKDKETYGLYFP